MQVLDAHRFLASGRQATLDKSGTAWPSEGQTADLLSALGEYREQQLAEQLETTLHLTHRRRIADVQDSQYSSYCLVQSPRDPFIARGHRGFLLQLPDGLSDVDQIVYNGARYESLRDFAQSGKYLIFDSSVPMFQGREFAVLCASRQTNALTNFWSNVLAYRDVSPGADRFYRAIHACAQTTFSQASLCELLAAAVGVPCVKVQSTVQQVIPARDWLHGPLVITEHETLAGGQSDIATVSEGDTVYPGDLVYNSLRFVDFQAGLPNWLTELTIPSRYLGYFGFGPVTFSTETSPAAGFDTQDNLLHLYPYVTGDTKDVAKFHSEQSKRERLTGVTLAQFLTNKANPQASEIAAVDLNWLEVLWSTWLKFGVSASVVRDKPTDTVLRRLGQVRRVTPPWITHLIQYLQPPEQPNDC